MSQQELERVEVVALRRSGQIEQGEAARRLGISARQMRRLELRVAQGGPQALRSGKRGRPSRRRIAPETSAAALKLIEQRYRDFGPTLAAEYLAREHGIELSEETVRGLMIEARLWRPKRGPAARIYALRERRAHFGELIQVDGSLHAWFEQRGPQCSLLVFIDDATSRITACRFVPRESTLGYMQTLHEHILAYGLPQALYSDRHSVFSVNRGDKQDITLSQFARALACLGIEGICANSPQAKGRVERANRTLQDRLVKALRLGRIDSIEAANQWLPAFIERHNMQFAVPPANPHDAHVRYLDSDQALKRILAKQHPRILSQQLSCQFQSTVLQARFESGGLGMRGAPVTVIEHFDHRVELLWRQRPLAYTSTQRQRTAPPVLSRKDMAQPATPTCAPAKQPPPAKRHPWRITPIGSLSPEFVQK